MPKSNYPTKGCQEGATRCNGNVVEQCQNGQWVGIASCACGCSNGECNPLKSVTDCNICGTGLAYQTVVNCETLSLGAKTWCAPADSRVHIQVSSTANRCTEGSPDIFDAWSSQGGCINYTVFGSERVLVQLHRCNSCQTC